MSELLLGILCGIALSLFFSFGPAFFSQLRMSIQYGFSRSFPFAFGVSAADVVMVFLTITIMNRIDIYEILHNVWVASIGGAVLIVMGVVYWRREVKSLDAMEAKRSRVKFKSVGGEPRRRTILAQGFAISFLNPLIWLYWISLVTLLTGELNLTAVERYVFFVGVLVTTLGLDILKCKLASLLQRIVTARLLNITNKVCAVFMFVFAVYLVASMINYQVNPQVREREQQQAGQPSTEMIKKIHNMQKSDSGTFIPLPIFDTGHKK